MSILWNCQASLIASAFMKTCFGISCGTALGTRKIPGRLWKSGQKNPAHFPTATTTTSPQNQSCSLRSAYCILREDNSNYFGPGQRVIPKKTTKIPHHAAHLRYNSFNQRFPSPDCAD